jgi:AcrR family transcriptional regulator
VKLTPAERRERRRESLLAAAFDLFGANPVDAVSMADVVRRAGGSLQTCYGFFPSKQALMEALVDRLRAQLFERQAPLTEQAPRDMLVEAAARLRALATSAEFQTMMRLARNIKLRDPGYGAALRSDIAAIGCTLTTLFERWRFDQPGLCATLFVGAVIGEAQLPGLMGDAARGEGECALIRAAVDLFAPDTAKEIDQGKA